MAFDSGATLPAMRPIVFDGRRGWLHEPTPPPTAAAHDRVGVVICSPLGRDARCVHLSMRLFAEQLARRGIAALRYDHADTGESLDLPPGADALPVWLADIARAAELLRAQAGVTRVVLCGARLGGALAAAAAAAVQADALVLFGPVVSGRSWTAKAAFAAQAASGGTASAGAASASGGLDTDGMVLSPATVRSLASLDMLRMAAPQRVLVFTHGKTTDGYVRHLREDGVAVLEAPFVGHADLFLESHSNLIPQASFDRALAWLADAYPDVGSTPRDGETLARPDRAPGIEAAAARHGAALERPVHFGTGLHGLLTLPRDGRADGLAVLFCNTGGDPRAGIGRLAVQAGRELAEAGVASLRFDFAGLGDSPMPAGGQRSHVYEQDRREDMEAAIAFLAAQGFGRVAVFGICSGAYHALHAALRDGRVDGVFAVNPLRLVWTGEEIVFGDRATAYVDKLGDLSTWKRLASGRIQVATVARTLRAKLQAYVAAQARSGPAGELRKGLARLSARGGRLHLLIGAEDASLDEVQAYLGRGGERLARLPGMSVQIEPGLDHGLSRSASREAALQALWSWLGLPPRGARHPGPDQSPSSSTV
jgi:pimeloyl-ACP methyl ester carboxylesterase